MELQDIREFNADYHKNGTLVWKEIGKPTGKHSGHLRSAKNYNSIHIDDIKLPDNYRVDEKILHEAEEMYKLNNRLIPVYLRYDHTLVAGFELYALAKRLGVDKVPFIVQKMNKEEERNFRKSVTDFKCLNKKHLLKTKDGDTIYLSMGQRKSINHLFRLARLAKLNLLVFNNLMVSATDNQGNYVFGSSDSGISVRSMRKKLEDYLAKRK